ncbi:MAG: SRPBCC family protein [Myxococcota bacterium]
MEIERNITVRVPVEKAWDILGNQFHDVSSWASGIVASRRLDAVGPSGVANRQCDVPSFGTITEEVDSFDEQNRTFSYRVVSGAPSFATHMGNTWWLEARGPSETRISFRLKAELKPLAGFFMGWMMKRQMGKLCDQVCEDLQTYIETGTPSAAKRAALAKAA